MTKEVLISIEGLQFNGSPDADRVEIITAGNYYKKNNRHFVTYEEIDEGSEEVTKNLLKFDGDVFSITKRGLTNVDMVFEENKRNMTNYITPYGSLLIGIDADKIDIDETDDKISIKIDYALDINYEHMANCKIRMDISSKNEDSFNL